MIKEIRLVNATPTWCEIDNKGKIVRIIKVIMKKTVSPNNNIDTIDKRDNDDDGIRWIENKKAKSRLMRSSPRKKERNKDIRPWYKDINLKQAKELIKENILGSDNYILMTFWIPEGKKIRYGKCDGWVFSYLVEMIDYRSLNDGEIEKIKSILCKKWRELLSRNCLNKYFDFMENIGHHKFEDRRREQNISDAMIMIFGDGDIAQI